MENREDFLHDDWLERAVDAVLRDPVPGELPPDRVARLVAVVQRAANQPYPITLIERIKNMKLRTKIAVVAAAVLAIVGLTSLLVPGGGVALAFGDVAQALNSIHSATWKITYAGNGPQPKNETIIQNGIGMFLTPSHERQEMTIGGKTQIVIFDGEKDKALGLDPAEKTATVVSYKNVPLHSPIGGTFQALRQSVADAQSGEAGKVERLGAETIDGRRAEGFRIMSGPDITVWADPKTSLPIRVELDGPIPGCRIVITDIQVGMHLDESLFSLDVPAGYAVQPPQEQDVLTHEMVSLAKALRFAAEHNDGVFPPALRGEQGLEGIMRRAITTLEKNVKNSVDKNSSEVFKLQTELDGASGLLSAPADVWHYAGKDVKLSTPNRPIFWVKLKKKGAPSLVIYADLSVKEVPADKLPQAPQARGSAKP
jgi:outer membrane lipoprotein-sorting protein